MELNINTPVEKYEVRGIPVYVKREDLCAPPPGPPFSKIRGLYSHMKMLKKRGVKVVGYTESAISMAGWGVAWVAKQLKMKAVIFDPQYKNKTPELLLLHRKKWKELGAETIPIPAGRTKVNNYIAMKRLFKKYPDDGRTAMLPIGLRLPETVEETAEEWKRTFPNDTSPIPNTVVVCVGSGTICAGILKGSLGQNPTVIGVMAYGDSPKTKRKEILLKAGLNADGFMQDRFEFDLESTRYMYGEASDAPCPFPTHPNYDGKAWEWLIRHVLELTQPICFWNIGSQPVG